MGLSPSPYIIQMANRVLCQYYAFKFDMYVEVYLDDVWHNKKANVVDFDEYFSEKLQIRFKDSKKTSGNIITLLGVELNLSQKTAKIKSHKAEKIAASASKFIADGVISPSKLSAFNGRINYANKITRLGRVNSVELINLLAAYVSGGGDVQSEENCLVVSELVKRELQFWAMVKSHKPYMIGENKKRCISTLASDASMSRYGFYIDGRCLGGSFGFADADRPIAEKESLALAALVKASTSINNCDYSFLCDNKSSVGAFSKGRSSNKFINQLVAETLIHLNNRNCRAKFLWISTSRMTALADNPSRGVYLRDDFGLTSAGVDRLYDLEVGLQRRREACDLVSLFSSPVNNPLGVEYFSVDIDCDDSLCRRMDAFAALEQKALEGKKLLGGIFCFPPPLLVDMLLDYLVRIGIEEDCEVYLLVPADLCLLVKNKLGGLGSLRISCFCGPRNKTFLHKCPHRALSFVTLSGVSCQSQSKKIRLSF